MKKLLAISVIVFVLSSFCACSQKTGNKSLYEIVVVPSAWSDELDLQIKDYVKDRPELNVYQNMVEEKDAKYQALLIEDLMAQGVDAICLQPVDGSVLPMVEKVKENGIVVVMGDDFLPMIDRAEIELKK